jgi:hypothetical protein
MTRLSSAGVDLELARQQWEEGSRRVERARRDAALYARLNRDVELVLADLRRRVGQSFTLEELAGEYTAADAWAPALLHDAVPEGGPPPEPALATDAAFHRYARRAADYAP